MPLTHSEPDALARIYASSLLDLVKAGGQGKIEETLGELEDILELARADRNFNEFLASMILPAKKRETSLRAMLNGRVSDLTLKFLLVLNQKERLNHLPAIVAAFEQMVQESYGRIEVDVYTPTQLDPSELGPIKTRLQAMLGREPIMHQYTDASMIGGLRLQIGDQLIDASVETQLRKLRDRLNESGASEIRSRASRLIG